ncbi:hypothetical protein AV530_017215 [Patagioenas fasciata monilis]|uniref:Uncharacterized protein n=1 Tax=Patagioenas fasciata monilis TaxID=372326 RepID=A0A1V4JGH5_PATFA|nr:hypothetical protein AV530_017215 [Patagioenas fasciata monilis]
MSVSGWGPPATPQKSPSLQGGSGLQRDESIQSADRRPVEIWAVEWRGFPWASSSCPTPNQKGSALPGLGKAFLLFHNNAYDGADGSAGKKTEGNELEPRQHPRLLAPLCSRSLGSLLHPSTLELTAGFSQDGGGIC